MSAIWKTGSFLIAAADTVTTEKVVNTLTYKPLAVVFFYAGIGSTSSSVGRQHSTSGYGLFVSATERGCVSQRSQNSAAAAVEDSRFDNDACIVVVSSTGTVDGAADGVSMNSDGFTVVIDNQFPNDVEVHWLAIGGTEYRYATVRQWVEPGTANTDTTVTGPTQKLNVAFCMGLGSGTDPPSTMADTRIFFGVAVENDDGTVTNGVLGSFANDAATTMQALNYCRLGECVALTDSGIAATNSRGFIKKFVGNGDLTINYPEIAAATRDVMYLGLGGTARHALRTMTTLTNTSGLINCSSTLPFRPVGSLYISACQTAEAAADTALDDAIVSIGVYDGTNQRCSGWRNEDATADSEVTAYQGMSSVYRSANANAGTLDGEMVANKFKDNDIECQMADAESAGKVVLVMAVGNARLHQGCQETIG